MALVGAFGWGELALCACHASAKRRNHFVCTAFGLRPLLLLSALFGPFVREVDLFDGLGLLFQVFVASYGFLLWFRLIGIYEASSVVLSVFYLALSVALGLFWQKMLAGIWHLRWFWDSS